jgi:hypothetical protein
MTSGWIKLHKSLLDWEWFKDHKTVHVFNYCLLKANFKEGKFQGKVVPAGSFVTGRKQIAQDTGLSEQEVRTAIFKLKSTSNLTIKSTSKYSIISICNWEKYQLEQPTKPQRSNQRATTIEEQQEIKEDKKGLPDFIDLEIWEDFKSMRKSIKKPMSDRAQSGIIKKLSAFKADGFDPNASLENSIINCWQDVFPPKTAPKRERRPDAYQGM